MDWSSEKHPWSYLLPGFALIFAWSVISIAHAHQRTLASVNDSFTRASIFMDRLGTITDDLDRLSVDQRAFLSTGDMRFQDGVIESSERLTMDIGMLNAMAARNEMERLLLVSLSRSIDQVQASVGESDTIATKRGRAAAAAFFESREVAVSEAKGEATQLKTEMSQDVSDRIRNARMARAFLQDLLYIGPAGTGFKHSRRPLIGRVSAAAVGP